MKIKNLQTAKNSTNCKQSYDLNIRPNGIVYMVPASVNQKRIKPSKGDLLHDEIIKHDNGQITRKRTYENGTQIQDWNGLKVEINGSNISKIKKSNNLKNRGYVLNSRAKAKIQNAIQYAYDLTAENLSKKLRFFTFTLNATDYINRLKDFETSGGSHPDQFYIKKFGQMLDKEVRIKKNIDSYVWTAEKTKQGVIHFHAIFITPLRNKYARHLSDVWSTYAQFTTSSTNCVHYGYSRSNKTEAMQNNNFDNGISPEAISNYLTKYVSKNQSTIYGRGYGMSKDFTRLQRESTRKVNDVNFFTYETTTIDAQNICKTFIELPNKSKLDLVDFETGEIITSSNIVDYEKQKTMICCEHITTINMSNGLKIFIFKIPRNILLRQFYPENYKINLPKIKNRQLAQYQKFRFQSKKRAKSYVNK